jgi:DNA replication protein DnaD
MDMAEREVATRRKIQVRMVEDERGRLKYYRLSPFNEEEIEVIVDANATEPIEIRKSSHHLTEEKARYLIATLQRAVKLLEPAV